MRKILFLTILIFVFVNFILIALDRTPPEWDGAWYLCSSIELYVELLSQNLLIFLQVFLHSFEGNKAPLISLLPMPFYLILGASYLSAMMVNVCFIVLSSLFIFKLVKFIEANDTAALSAVIIMNTMPLFHILSREFLVEYGLSTLVLMSAYFLIKSDYLSNDKYTRLFGYMLGLGLLMKSIFPFYLLGPVFVVFHSIVKYQKNTFNRELANKIFKIIIMGFMIASIWYAFNLKTVLGYGFAAGYGGLSKFYSLGKIFSITTITKYLDSFIREGISLFYFIVFLLCLFLFIIRRKLIKFRFLYDTLIFAWFLLPFLTLLFAPNKILRFLLPCLVPLAIILGIWLSRIFKRRGIILLLFPLFFFVVNPFISLPLVKAIFNSPAIDTKSDWKINEVIDAVPFRGWVVHTILCAVDHPYYNNFTLRYYSIIRCLPYRFDSVSFCKNIDQLSRLIQEADLILVKTGYLGPDSINVFSSRVRNFVANNKFLFKEIKSFELPDKSYVSLYERLP